MSHSPVHPWATAKCILGQIEMRRLGLELPGLGSSSGVASSSRGGSWHQVLRMWGPLARPPGPTRGVPDSHLGGGLGGRVQGSSGLLVETAVSSGDRLRGQRGAPEGGAGGALQVASPPAAGSLSCLHRIMARPTSHGQATVACEGCTTEIQ